MSASPTTNEPPKMSLWKRANRIAVVPLFGIAVIALLTSMGVLSYSTCEWTKNGDVGATKGTADAPMKVVSLVVRAGDNDIAKRIREGVTAGLTEGGVAQIVSNPTTWPRAEIVVEEMRGRWTPFWAPLFVKTRVFLDLKKRDGRVVDGTVQLEGSCTGLVSKDTWRFDWIPGVVDDAVKQLLRKP